MTDALDIYDRAMVVIQDYRLDGLYNRDYNSFLLFMKGLLRNSIDLFNGCLNDLSYTDIEEEETIKTDDNQDEVVKITHTYFNKDLTFKEQSILAMIVVYQWFEREVQDVKQFSNHLNTRDFKTESSYMNFKQKNEYLDKLREVYLQEINNYQIENMDALVNEIGGL